MITYLDRLAASHSFNGDSVFRSCQFIRINADIFIHQMYKGHFINVPHDFFAVRITPNERILLKILLIWNDVDYLLKQVLILFPSRDVSTCNASSKKFLFFQKQIYII